MICDLSTSQLLLIIIGIIVVALIIKWFLERNNDEALAKIHHESFTPVATTVTPQNTPETPCTLLYFYAPWCPHCTNLDKVWNQLSASPLLTLKKVDATLPENSNLGFYYNVSGYPTIILTTPTSTVEYNGDRTIADLKQFIQANCHLV